MSGGRPRGAGCGERVSPSLHGRGLGTISRKLLNFFLRKIIKMVHFHGIYVNFVGHFTCCFYNVIAEMLSMDVDDTSDKP